MIEIGTLFSTLFLATMIAADFIYNRRVALQFLLLLILTAGGVMLGVMFVNLNTGIQP